MKTRENRNILIQILINLTTVFFVSTMFLAYKLLEAVWINKDLDKENISVLRECRELRTKINTKEKQGTI